MSLEITDNVAFLNEAKTTLLELTDKKEKLSDLEKEEVTLEKALTDEKNLMEDSIRTTIKKRSDEINSSYDKEVAKIQASIKKANLRRSKAKNKEVRARINDETDELKQEITQLNREINILFKQHDIPGICNSRLYYALYFTKGVVEFLVFILSFLLTFLALPYLIYFVIPNHQFWHMIIIYAIIVLVIGGGYIFLNNRTKAKHFSVMKQGREIRDKIHKDKKEIKKISKAIAKDENEEYYNLGDFDKQIKTLEDELTDIYSKKQDALSNFENVTKEMLTNEIKANSQPKIDELNQTMSRTSIELGELQSMVKNLTIDFTDNYESYIGKEFLEVEKLDQLISIIESGEAPGIVEAQNVYKQKFAK